MGRHILLLTTIVLVPIWALLTVISGPMRTAGSPPVLIVAVLYDGYADSDDDEAVRIQNVTDGVVDVSGWQVNDGESSTVVIPSKMLFPLN